MSTSTKRKETKKNEIKERKPNKVNQKKKKEKERKKEKLKMQEEKMKRMLISSLFFSCNECSEKEIKRNKKEKCQCLQKEKK